LLVSELRSLLNFQMPFRAAGVDAAKDGAGGAGVWAGSCPAAATRVEPHTRLTMKLMLR
jgi:hypothetical protein